LFNNFENSTENSVYWSAPNSINASYNWWGTTDTAAINESIHDFKNDFNLGIVNFVPFLTAPNPQAMPNPNIDVSPLSPSPTQSPNQTPSVTPTSTVPEFPSWIILSLTTIMTLIAAVIVRRTKARE
jgi:hypothetical protein